MIELTLFPLEFHLIPFGIALLWYASSDPAKVGYKDTPYGAINLLPCMINPLRGDKNFFIVEIRGSRTIRITVGHAGLLRAE